MDYAPLTPAPDDQELERIEMEGRAAIALMKDLDRKFNNLSEGKPDSKSSDIEDLYARKEESVLNLKNQLKVLSRYQKTIKELVQKHSQKLGILNDGKRTLSSKQAKKKYSFAEFIQENKYRKVMSCQKELNRVIDCAQKAIKLADTRKFPGGNPKKKFQAMIPKTPFQPQPDIVSPPVMSHIPVISSNPHSLTDQVNSLISSGPVGK